MSAGKAGVTASTRGHARRRPHFDIHKFVCPRCVCPGLCRANVGVGERNRLGRVHAAAEVGPRHDARHLAPLLCAWPVPRLRDQARRRHCSDPLRDERVHRQQRQHRQHALRSGRCPHPDPAAERGSRRGVGIRQLQSTHELAPPHARTGTGHARGVPPRLHLAVAAAGFVRGHFGPRASFGGRGGDVAVCAARAPAQAVQTRWQQHAAARRGRRRSGNGGQPGRGRTSNGQTDPRAKRTRGRGRQGGGWSAVSRNPACAACAHARACQRRAAAHHASADVH